MLVCAAFIGLFSIFSFRLIYLQAIKHDEYAGLAAEKHVYKQIIYAERGMILDANKRSPRAQHSCGNGSAPTPRILTAQKRPLTS